MKTYLIKNHFFTLQGEGTRAGSPSLFVRFAGCNLWDGRPEHRAQGKGECARWCDTDFVGGTKLTAEELLDRMEERWPKALSDKWCVLTGGEPLLQADAVLCTKLHDAGWQIAVETNGTVEVNAAWDWITCSPKRGGKLKLTRCNELKVVLPGSPVNPWKDHELGEMSALAPAGACFVQPQDPLDHRAPWASHLVQPMTLKPVRELDAEYERNVQRCLDFVKSHAGWRLSLQTHKLLKIP